jgi:hypothetical protein
VTDAIRQSIVDAEFRLDEALSESSLAARLGVRRTPVREAIAAMEAAHEAGTSALPASSRTNAARCHPRACSTARMLLALKPSCTWPRTISVGVPRASVAS